MTTKLIGDGEGGWRLLIIPDDDVEKQVLAGMDNAIAHITTENLRIFDANVSGCLILEKKKPTISKQPGGEIQM